MKTGKKPFVIALFHVKGGVGKTTACISLSHTASTEGFSTLLIDLDPQGASTYSLRIEREGGKEKAVSLLAGGKAFDSFIRASDYPKLHVFPATSMFRELPIMLDKRKHKKRVLSESIHDLPYDLIFVDAPPSMGLEATNIVKAANAILVPVIPDTFGIHALSLLDALVDREDINNRIVKLFFSLVDARLSAHRTIMEKIKTTRENALQTCIPYCADIEKALAKRIPPTAFTRTSRGITNYVRLWHELRNMFNLQASHD